MTNNANWQPVTELIGSHSGCRPQVESVTPVGGGCINSTYKLTMANRKAYFVKRNTIALLAMFEAELLGLQSLARTQSVRVPSPIGTCHSQEHSFLVMNWISPGASSKSTHETLGRELAAMHRFESATDFGYELDNFIGSTPQQNRWNSSWKTFFLRQRLEPQLRIAKSNGYGTHFRSPDKLLTNIEVLLNESPKPSLIHGDLWSGNFMVDTQGNPILIDPAPYWSDREAEFGIVTMFGGFEKCFFDAYHETCPFESGFEQRLLAYQLYHYLNHLNLFGGAYLGQVQKIIAKIG